MTHRDFELIATVLASVESMIYSDDAPNAIALGTLDVVTDEFVTRLKETNPRFDVGRFEKYARPIKSDRLKKAMAILAKLAEGK